MFACLNDVNMMMMRVDTIYSMLYKIYNDTIILSN